MNRRELFDALAAAALAPGELWAPGKRTIFLPPRSGWWFSRVDLGCAMLRPAGTLVHAIVRREGELDADFVSRTWREVTDGDLERAADWVNARRKPRAMPPITFEAPTSDWGKVKFVVIGGAATRR